MTEDDFHNFKTFKFFNEVINVQFVKYEFELVPNSIKKSNELLYVLEYKRQFTDTFGKLKYSDILINAIPANDNLISIFSFCDNKQKIHLNVNCNFDEKNSIILNFQKNFILPLINLCSTQLIDLPIDVKIEILKNLKAKSLVNLSKTNKYWYFLIKTENSLWKNLCYKDFTNKWKIIKDKEPNLSWKKIYEKISKEVCYNIKKRNEIIYLPESLRFL